MKNNCFLIRLRDTLCIYFSLSGFIIALRTLFFRIGSINMLTYEINTVQSGFSVWWCFVCCLPALIFLSRSSFSDNLIRKIALSVMPFLAGFFLPADRFVFFPFFLIMLGWGTARLARTFSAYVCRKHLKSGSAEQIVFFEVVLLITYFMAVAWGFYLQAKSAKNLFICYSDWGIYVESYLRLIHSNAGWKAWLSTGSHWNPLVNVLMAGFVKLFPYQEALFLFNSMLVYSVVPLLWVFGLRIGLKPFHCFCLAMAAAFCPVYGNLSLSVYYGFRPIHFAIPLIILFFMFQRTGSRIGMTVCLVATLLLKETMMIFWLGYGLWLLCRRKWISGALFAAGGAAGFWLLSCVVLPKLVHHEVYPLTFLYSTLGSTPLDVVRSSVVNPGAFWGVVFQWQNYAFLSILLVPFFFCIWLFPDMMIVLVPLLAGICLRSSPEVKNIALWYGLEATTLLAALAVINSDRIRLGEYSFWTRIVFWRQRGCGSRDTRLTALLVAVLVVNIAAHYCLALTSWGKYSFRPVMDMPDGSDVIAAIKGHLTPNARVLASERLRNHFMYEHVTADFSVSRKAGDFLVMSLHDRSIDTAEKLESVRRAIAADPNIIPIDSFNLSGRHIVVFKVTDGKEPGRIRKLPQISSTEFEKIGVPFPAKSEDFKIRYLFQNDRHVFLIRLEKTPDHDFDFAYFLAGPWGQIHSTQVFGWGLYPAYSCPAGTVFMVEHKAPLATTVKCFALERKASRIKR